MWITLFTVTTAEQFLDAVLDGSDLDPIKHYHFAAIASCRALRGAPTRAAWRERAAAYPDALEQAVLEAVLSPERFPGWSAREALAERGDTIAVRSLLSAIAQGVFSAGSLAPVLDWTRRNLTARSPSPISLESPRRVHGPLARRFAATVGLSPMQWLTAQRVSRAQELLEQTNISIERIAELSGLGSTANLRVHFGRSTATTPHSYRRTFSRRP